jgi:hypothetical protein
MNASNLLHQLVRSLNAEERAYISNALQQGRKGRDSLYFKLFERLVEQSHYDEKLLMSYFSGSSFGKSLAFPKSHLYDLVLSHLQEFHQGKSLGSSFLEELQRIELLSEKGLAEHALRLIRRSLDKVMALEDATKVLQLLRLKRRQMVRLQKPDLTQELRQLSQQEQIWEKQFLQEQAATRLHDEIYANFQEVRRKNQAVDNPWLKLLELQLKDLLMDQNLSFPARVAALRATSHLHHMREDFGAVHDAYQAEIAIWDRHPLQIQHAQLRYVRLLGQWLTSKALSKDFDSLLRESSKLRHRTDLDHHGKAEVFQTTYTLELYYHLNSQQPQKALPLLPQISEGLEKYDAMLPPSAKLGFYYNIALVHWLCSQPGMALKWVLKIQQFEKGPIRKDIRDFAPLLEMVLHYELGNISRLESWFRSTRYHNRKAENPLSLELILADYIHQLLNATGQDREKLHGDFLQQLEDHSRRPGVSQLGIQELKLWPKLLRE